jgi:hypothetical protein
MRNHGILICLLILFTGLNAYAGGDKDKIWLDHNLEECKRSKAVRYMEVTPDGDTYVLHMYTLDKELCMKGAAVDRLGRKWEGNFEFYHANGTLESKGHYVAHTKVGLWERYDLRGNRLAERTYAAYDTQRSAYTYVDEMPLYDGGNKNFKDFLKQKLTTLVYNTEPGGNDLTLELGFVVSEDGTLSGVEFTKGLDPDWDVAALNELKTLPSWLPGKKSGDPVRVFVRVPIDLSR